MPLQFSVVLFAGMAAAMLMPAVRRSLPGLIEALIWVGLIIACWLAVTNIREANTRLLTESAAWGASQIVNTSIGLLITGVLGSLSGHRYGIAISVVLVAAVDVLLLALVWSRRKAKEWQPRIMLGEWIEVPMYRRRALVPAPLPYAMDVWNRRAEHAIAMLGAAFLTWFVEMLIWTREGRDTVMTDDQIINARTV